MIQDNHYSWEGVLQFLHKQHETHAQQENIWFLQKKGMSQQIKELEARVTALQNINNDLLNRNKMLEYCLRKMKGENVQNELNRTDNIPKIPQRRPKPNKNHVNKILQSLGIRNLIQNIQKDLEMKGQSNLKIQEKVGTARQKEKDIPYMKSSVYSNTHTLTGHQDGVRDLLFHSDQQYLISASQDCTLKYWKIGKQSVPECWGTIREHSGPIFTIVEGQKLVFTGGMEGIIRAWDFRQIKQKKDISKKNLVGTWNNSEEDKLEPIWQLLYCPESKIIFSTSSQSSIKSYHLKFDAQGVSSTFKKSYVLTSSEPSNEEEDIPTSICLHKNQLVSGYVNSHSLIFFDLDTGKAINELKISSNAQFSTNKVVNHPHMIIAGYQDKMVRLFDTNKMINSFKAHEDSVMSIATTSNLNQFFTCGHDGYVKLWDLRKLEPISSFNVTLGQNSLTQKNMINRCIVLRRVKISKQLQVVQIQQLKFMKQNYDSLLISSLIDKAAANKCIIEQQFNQTERPSGFNQQMINPFIKDSPFVTNNRNSHVGYAQLDTKAPEKHYEFQSSKVFNHHNNNPFEYFQLHGRFNKKQFQSEDKDFLRTSKLSNNLAYPLSKYQNKIKLNNIDTEYWKRQREQQERYKLSHYGAQALRYSTYSPVIPTFQPRTPESKQTISPHFSKVMSFNEQKQGEQYQTIKDSKPSPQLFKSAEKPTKQHQQFQFNSRSKQSKRHLNHHESPYHNTQISQTNILHAKSQKKINTFHDIVSYNNQGQTSNANESISSHRHKINESLNQSYRNPYINNSTKSKKSIVAFENSEGDIFKKGESNHSKYHQDYINENPYAYLQIQRNSVHKNPYDSYISDAGENRTGPLQCAKWSDSEEGHEQKYPEKDDEINEINYPGHSEYQSVKKVNRKAIREGDYPQKIEYNGKEYYEIYLS